MNIYFKLIVYVAALLVSLNVQARHFPFYFDRSLAGDPPVAVLPQNMVVNIGAMVTISGAMSSDPEGMPLAYRWSFDILPEGSNAQMSDPTADSVSFVADVVGVYIVKLVVYDETIDSVPAYLSVRVSSPNQPPLSGGAWVIQQEGGLPALIKVGIGGQFDPDGQIVAYEYDFGDGESAYITAEESVRFTHLHHYYKSAGTYTIKITVIDDKGARATATRQVVIRDNQMPRPVFSASVAPNSNNPENYDIQLNAASATDPDGTVERYNWGVSGPDGDSSYNGISVTHTISSGQEGEYHISLTVWDNNNAYRHADTVVYVGVTKPTGGAPPTPIFSANSTLGTAPLTVNFDATPSFDIDGDSFKAYWYWDDYSAAQLGTTGLTPSYTFTKPGTYLVDLVLEDAHGNMSLSNVFIYVRRPGWSAEESSGPHIFAFVGYGEKQPRSITFDYRDDIHLDNIPYENYFWDFGDGSRERGPYQEHQYQHEGTYPITLTTIDVDGVRKQVTKLVTVRNDGGFPTLNLEVSSNNPPVNTLITFDHSGSQDATEFPLKFFYYFDDGSSPLLDITQDMVSYTFTTPGAYQVNSYAEEEGRAAIGGTHIYPIMGIPPTLRTRVSSRVGVAPFTVMFDASSSSDDGSIVSYDWFFQGNRHRDPNQYGSGVRASHTFKNPGEYGIRLAVTDDTGNIVFDYPQIIVLESANPNNQVPLASFTSTINGLSVDFDASTSSDSDGSIQFYDWDFGDGDFAWGYGHETHIGHQYFEAGSYTVTLKVTDSDGGIHTTTQTVVVTDSSSILLLRPKPTKNRPDQLAVKAMGSFYKKDMAQKMKNFYRSGCERINGRQHCYRPIMQKSKTVIR